MEVLVVPLGKGNSLEKQQTKTLPSAPTLSLATPTTGCNGAQLGENRAGFINEVGATTPDALPLP